jgi:signal peptidase I
VLAVAVLLPATLALGAAALVGWRFQVIETGSMAPAYPAGSLAVIEPVDPAEIRPGLTVVFEDPLVRGRLIAHRIVKRLPSSSPMWMTKGDANAESDPAPISSDAIQGRVRLAVPHVGRVVSSVSGPPALALLVGTPLLLLLLTELGGLRRRRRSA